MTLESTKVSSELTKIGCNDGVVGIDLQSLMTFDDDQCIKEMITMVILNFNEFMHFGTALFAFSVHLPVTKYTKLF